MNIILFGPAGSGKGTQAELLSKELSLFHFSMGDALRAEIARNTVLGKEVASIINKGMLVSDDVAEKVMMSVLDIKAKGKGIIFDGFPRNADQVKRLKIFFNIDAAIEIKISDDEVITRISARRICPSCKKNYNTIWIKPKSEGKCNECNTSLIMRDDDKPPEIKKRLDIYKKLTLPMKKLLEEQGILFEVNGKQPISDVNKDILSILEEAER
jgi:adenylate kinase